MQILLLNGPNLNLLGVREPEVYGKETFTDYFRQLKNKYPSVDISCFQSNVEGELIDKIHEVGFSYDGIILNAGAYTHTSIALADAIAAVKAPGGRGTYFQYSPAGGFPACFLSDSCLPGRDHGVRTEIL